MCTYSCGYAFHHTLAVVLVPAGVVLLATVPWYYGISALFFSLLLRLQWSRIRARVGCRAGVEPTTQKEILLLFKSSKNWTPVGSGWDFYQQRRVPSNKALYLHNFYNINPMEKSLEGALSKHWWKSGTTIGRVALYYKSLNKAFPSLPSIEQATLGAWIWSGSHGSSGDTGRPSNSCFEYVHYLNKFKQLQVVNYNKFNKQDALLILHVSFQIESMEPNGWLHKRAVKVDASNPVFGVREWLRPSYQRALFVGKRVVALQWTKKKLGNEVEHVDPHCCSRFCLWLQVDPCNAACGCCMEPLKNYASKVRLYEVNRFVPPVWRTPLLALSGILHRNYEIYCLLPPEVNSAQEINFFFRTFVQDLYQLHKQHGGRTELRFSGKILFVDVSLTQHFDSVFRILEELGVRAYALHEGKFQHTPKFIKMQKITPKDLFYAAKSKNQLRF